ncbi:lysophospholipid acyltransferase family protein [Pseudoroseicyclus tamaricis]|uniref:Acyltransferase n=1 Tax=Pseudoroseicyclus tamaricis TaxID=2705421 RepID=A0A6B2K338_9RHOB|nr:lysophospholipid acyltransferase family protein [Pseudoroseicyclus tamaricis]NDV02222.1 acyltransferase [Pseudoroseicyclus tamaricis]
MRAMGPVAPRQQPVPRVYDRSSLTYSETFDNPFKRTAIKSIEWMTGKLEVLRRVRRFERMGVQPGPDFWPGTMKAMGIEIQTPQYQIDRIPKTGPVVFVANHPHGMVDGMVLADLFARVRDDYRILSRSILTGLDESATKYMIPVPFPHEPDSQKKMVAMRAEAMGHLANGGLIALFPSGVVATSRTPFGPPIEAEWNPFTAKMIRRSGATVVPCYFPGNNSRWYQLANMVSPTLRQGLLIHEIVHSFDKPQSPIIGQPIGPEECEERGQDPRGFMTWLRARTLALGPEG